MKKAFLILLVFYLVMHVAWWLLGLRPLLKSSGLAGGKRPWEYGPFSRPGDFSNSVAGVEGQLALALKAVRETDPNARNAIAEKVTEPRARLFLARLEEMDASVKSFDPNGRVTDELVAKALAELPKDVVPPDRPGMQAIDGARMAKLGPLEKQALLSRNAAARKDAVSRIAAQDVIEEVAIGDADAGVRQAALERITDQATLVRLAMTETHWMFRRQDVDYAARRAAMEHLNLSRLDDPVRLERLATMARDDTVRVVALARLEVFRQPARIAAARERLTAGFRDAAALAQAAISHPDPVTRHSVVAKLADQSALKTVAQEANDFGVRLAAAAKITDVALRRSLSQQLATSGPETGQAMTVDLGDASATAQLLWVAPTKDGGLGAGAEPEGETKTSPGVIMTKGFWLGRTEVSQAQWKAVMQGGTDEERARFAQYPSSELWKEMARSNPSVFAGRDLPVENVSWDSAMEFCRRLTERERAAGRLPPGWVYTLPTEEQWVFAAQAGTEETSAGDLDHRAWYLANSRGTTHPVGTKRPNAWGFCDMQGNVWEWCCDRSEVDPRNTGADPKVASPRSAPEHFGRGGDWNCDERECRSNIRCRITDRNRRTTGFRLALAPVPLLYFPKTR